LLQTQTRLFTFCQLWCEWPGTQHREQCRWSRLPDNQSRGMGSFLQATRSLSAPFAFFHWMTTLGMLHSKDKAHGLSH